LKVVIESDAQHIFGMSRTKIIQDVTLREKCCMFVRPSIFRVDKFWCESSCI